MDCKDWVKARQNSGKGADCKEKVKEEGSAGKEENCKGWEKVQRSFGKEDFYENEVKRQQNSGKAELCEDGVKRRRNAGQGRKITRDGQPATRANASSYGRSGRQPASACEQVVPERKMTTTMRGGRGMVEKEGRQTAENSVPRGKAQKAAPARRKGTFYLMLASWWPTTKGCRRWARKGVERRLRAFEESQNCAAKV